MIGRIAGELPEVLLRALDEVDDGWALGLGGDDRALRGAAVDAEGLDTGGLEGVQVAGQVRELLADSGFARCSSLTFQPSAN